jgi:TonB family protein
MRTNSPLLVKGMRARGAVLVLSCLFYAGPQCAAGEHGEALACKKRYDLATDERGVRVLSMTELEHLATRRAAIRPPSSVRAEGCIRVEIVINTDGKVGCARAENGHPLLQSAAVEAARSWEFRPWLEKGKPVAILGVLALPVSTSGNQSSCLANPE